MTDLISRADAIEAVRKCVIQDVGDWAMLVDKAEAILALNALPSAEAYFTDGNKIAEWIPCSKGLPKAEYGESDCVLATCCWKTDTQTRWIEKLYFNGGNWCYPTGECFTQKVLAWTPMIEPYREDGEI